MAHRYIKTRKVRAPIAANDEPTGANVALRPIAIAGILGFTAVWTGIMYPIGLLQRWRRK